MEELFTAQPYDGRITGRASLIGFVSSKIYFGEIRGREEKSKYEWGSDSDKVQKRIIRGIFNSIFYSKSAEIPSIAVVFPGISQAWRWGDPRIKSETETGLYPLGVGFPNELENMRYSRENNPSGAFCLIENYITAEEISIRAKSDSMEEYLGTYADIHSTHPTPLNLNFKNPNLLRDYLSRFGDRNNL